MKDGKLILWEGVTVTCTEGESKKIATTSYQQLSSSFVSLFLLFILPLLLLFPSSSSSSSHHTSHPHRQSPRSTLVRIYLQLPLKLAPKVCNVVPSCDLAQTICKWAEINAGTTKVAVLPLRLTVMAILQLVALAIRRLVPHLKFKPRTL